MASYFVSHSSTDPSTNPVLSVLKTCIWNQTLSQQPPCWSPCLHPGPPLACSKHNSQRNTFRTCCTMSLICLSPSHNIPFSSDCKPYHGPQGPSPSICTSALPLECSPLRLSISTCTSLIPRKSLFVTFPVMSSWLLHLNCQLPSAPFSTPWHPLPLSLIYFSL